MMCGRLAARALGLGLSLVVGCASDVPTNRDDREMFMDSAVSMQDAVRAGSDGAAKPAHDASAADASVPDPGPVKQLARVVGTASSLNIRSGPSTDNMVVGSAPEGCVVTLLGESDGVWRKVEYKGTRGWCHGDYLADVQPDAADCSP